MTSTIAVIASEAKQSRSDDATRLENAPLNLFIRALQQRAQPASQRSETALEIGTLDAVRHQRESAPIRLRGGLERAEPAQHVGARGVVEVIAVELSGYAELVDQRQPAARPFGHADRDGTIEPHDRARLEPRQFAVEGGDLR